MRVCESCESASRASHASRANHASHANHASRASHASHASFASLSLFQLSRSTCLPCRNLDLIKNSGAKIITVNYYACKFHKSCRFQLNFVNRLSFDISIVDFRSAQI